MNHWKFFSETDHLIANALKCVGVWGSAIDPASDAPQTP